MHPYIGPMKKRINRILMALAGLAAVLAIAAVGLFLWLTRNPTTQLLDASGQKLTAGPGLEDETGLFGGPVFAEVHTLIADKAFADAKQRLLQIVEESDRDGEACVLLADVSRELKEADAATDYGLKAIQLLPDSPEAHLSYAKALGLQMFSDMQSLGGMLSAMARVGPFKTELERVIALDPDDTEARTMLALSYLAPKPIGNMDEAMRLSHEIEVRDPIRGRLMLAACYRRNEATGQAIALLHAGLEEFPKEGSFHVALGDIHAEEKHFDAADAEYEAARVDAKSESYYRSLYNQARMRVQNEFEPERAIALLSEFIAAEPEGENMPSAAHAFWRKGNALEQLGRNQDARAAYQESLRRDPTLKLAEKAIKSLQG